MTYPSGTRSGTVLFSTGQNGLDLYENFAYGSTTLNTVLGAGFTVAQISWGAPFANQPAGWQTGPGGIRAVACRYATLAEWIYANIHMVDTGAPFCATGNSSGSELIGQALTHYGMASIFAMVEPTSGPPFARQDCACDCRQPNTTTDPCGHPQGYCVGLGNAQKYVDPAYAPPVSCSQEVMTQTTTYDAIFLQDSVVGPSDSVFDYPTTFVNFLYGSEDNSSAPNQGELWYSAISSSKNQACVPGAGHSMPDYLPGAQHIASDIVTYCKLPKQ